MEAVMVDFTLQAHRGNFHLDISCQLSAPWTILFGPSGAGKSTILRMIAGLEKPDAGRIAAHGEYLTDTEIGLNLPPGKRQIGLVSQQPALFPHMTVEANIAYGLANLTPRARQEHITGALDLVAASHLAPRFSRSLSGGEAQRIALARAIAPLPRLLLLDEPLSALDASARDSVLSNLQSWLTSEHIQTILVTHDAADALATSAEVALIQDGKLKAHGPASEVLAQERYRLLTRLNHK
jgi:ABC-type sulfate/molybdate transport systems ATPase subunit